MLKKTMSDLKDISAARDLMKGKAAGKLPGRVAAVPVTVGEIHCEWITTDRTEHNRVLLYLHGGGYVLGGLDSHRGVAWRLADAAGMRVLLVDYRLAPEHPFPAALDDATACYRFLLEEGYRPENIAIGGDSAGAGLALSTMVNLKNLGLSLPVCGILMSPWLDLSLSGDSVTTNAEADPMLSPSGLKDMAGHYLGTRDPRAPLASPLFADLKDLPPLLVHVGSTEVLLSDAERLVDKAESAGVEIELTVWDKMPHVFQLFAGMVPEANQAVAALGKFVAKRTGSIQL